MSLLFGYKLDVSGHADRETLAVHSETSGLLPCLSCCAIPSVSKSNCAGDRTRKLGARGLTGGEMGNRMDSWR